MKSFLSVALQNMSNCDLISSSIPFAGPPPIPFSTRDAELTGHANNKTAGRTEWHTTSLFEICFRFKQSEDERQCDEPGVRWQCDFSMHSRT